ncbi:aldo/keto reductase [Paractinoplanes ferrugineus]|uniref:Aldo/keto reductase n=1 Tax=Paractinoplanes ferrugineus TaxID=113564 RepID=A0A919J4U1_9ACTN|nr:aldo/keto reductase [Actinoplanes ferrugineus]GIE10611.1 aldo/keto reductase [Actinoplanes ferrugineus]
MRAELPKHTIAVRDRGGYRQSVLILGTAQLGMAYGIANRTGAPDDDATTRMLAAARDLGITHLDTARAYGDSEQRIGVSAPPELSIITKIAPGAEVRSSIEASRAALRRGGPLTLLFHRAADALGGGWDELRACLATGSADRIGVSVQNPDELRAVLDLPDLGYVQLPCNILDRRWPDPALRREDLVVTVRSAYLQGLLVAGSAVPWPRLPDAERDAVVAILDRLVADLGRAGRADLCIAYLRSLPWVTSLVVGAETEDQLRDNADLVRREPLTDSERDAVLAALPPMPDALLDPSRWNR